MSYLNNINEIDNTLKNIFEQVSINTNDHRILDIKLSKPSKDSMNENLEMRLFVSQKNLNNISPILEWGYYTDPSNPTDSISFKSSASRIGDILNDVITNNRLNESYLDTIKGKVEKINESVEEEIVEEVQLNQTYELSEQYMKLFTKKLQSYLMEQLGLLVDDVEIKHFDESSGQLVSPTFANPNNTPSLGDISEVTLRNITSTSYDGNVSPKGWVLLEERLRQIPFVENLMVSTQKYSVEITFSTKVLVELY